MRQFKAKLERMQRRKDDLAESEKAASALEKANSKRATVMVSWEEQVGKEVTLSVAGERLRVLTSLL